MKEIIDQTLNVLKYMQLKDIGRAADLEWFVFSSIDNREEDMESTHLNLEYTIHIFPDDSLGEEFWRFFQLDSETRHFVVTGNGIE